MIASVMVLGAFSWKTFDLEWPLVTENLILVNLDLALSGLNATVVLFLTMDLCVVLKSLHILGISMIMVLSDA